MQTNSLGKWIPRRSVSGWAAVPTYFSGIIVAWPKFTSVEQVDSVAGQDFLGKAYRDAWTHTDALQINPRHSKDGDYFQFGCPTLVFSIYHF